MLLFNQRHRAYADVCLYVMMSFVCIACPNQLWASEMEHDVRYLDITGPTEVKLNLNDFSISSKEDFESEEHFCIYNPYGDGRYEMQLFSFPGMQTQEYNGRLQNQFGHTQPEGVSVREGEYFLLGKKHKQMLPVQVFWSTRSKYNEPMIFDPYRWHLFHLSPSENSDGCHLVGYNATIKFKIKADYMQAMLPDDYVGVFKVYIKPAEIIELSYTADYSLC